GRKGAEGGDQGAPAGSEGRQGPDAQGVLRAVQGGCAATAVSRQRLPRAVTGPEGPPATDGRWSTRPLFRVWYDVMFVVLRATCLLERTCEVQGGPFRWNGPIIVVQGQM